MDFPPIPKDFSSIDGAFFDFDDSSSRLVMQRLYSLVRVLLLLLELQRLLGLVVELLPICLILRVILIHSHSLEEV